MPQGHLRRKIIAAINFNRIYEFMDNLYLEDSCWPGIGPMVLFRIVLIQHTLNSFLSQNSGISKHKSGIPVIHWISAKRSSTNLFNGELQLQAQV